MLDFTKNIKDKIFDKLCEKIKSLIIEQGTWSKHFKNPN
jgi:hypothetical protein